MLALLSALAVASIISVVLSLLLLRFDDCQTGEGQEDKASARSELLQQVNRLLPQTQCGKCGYAGCAPYAAALIHANESLSLCPPGGNRTQNKLARLLGRSENAGDNGRPAARIAHIDPDRCIGCVKCLHVCPVDAIIGAARQLHVIIPAHCTGCELCLPPCPVDCIRIIPAPPPHWQWQNPAPRYGQAS